jgi:hypothetical protein
MITGDAVLFITPRTQVQSAYLVLSHDFQKLSIRELRSFSI